MPLDEEGAKWSCEPCIRGHRSSKCMHFDRLMMKVAKAGRPLAKCPHPKGSCSCQKLYAFMIRIPRGSTCLCRPVYQVPADTSETAPATTPAPIAPTNSHTPGPSKVQKSVKRQSKAAPENIARALNAMPDYQEQNTEAGSSSASQAQIPGYSDNVTDADSPQSAPASLNSFGVTERKSASSPPTATCCSKNQHRPEPKQKIEAPSSCCGNSSPAANDSSERGTLAVGVSRDASIAPSNGFSFAPPSMNQATDWRNYYDYEDSGNHPRAMAAHEPHTGEPSSVRSIASGPQSHLASQPYGGVTSDSVFSRPPAMHTGPNQASNASYLPYHAQAAHDGDPAHDCSCGDTCQCLGCASHPYNQTTVQHVQQMGYLVTRDMYGHPQSVPVSNMYPAPAYSHPAWNYEPRPQAPWYEYGSGSADYASPQQTMIPSQYLTLEYPVGLPSACSDITGSCQCGNDCSCVGCLTHSGHNGVPANQIPTQNHRMPPVEAPHSYMNGAAVNTSRIPAMDNMTAHFPGPVL